MGAFMIAFTGLCLVAAMLIRIRDLEEERDGGEKILRRCAPQDDTQAGMKCEHCQYHTKDGRCLYMVGCPYKERK
jgi:hypothetical protein